MKAQQEVETSDDRNGVVVNRARSRVHAIDSTRRVPKQLVEERCEKQFANSCKKQFGD